MKRQNGITLVALVITIIILLILAGISIASLKNTGLFDKTQKAKNATENAQIKENKTIDEFENYLKNQCLKTTFNGIEVETFSWYKKVLGLV